MSGGSGKIYGGDERAAILCAHGARSQERGLSRVRLVISDACLGLPRMPPSSSPRPPGNAAIVGSLKKWSCHSASVAQRQTVTTQVVSRTLSRI